MSDSLSFVERLEIERACEKLLYTYMRAIDQGDMDAVADCFVEQGSLARPLAPDQIVQGREAIRAAMKSRPKTLLTRHLVTNVSIEVESRDAARGISYLVMIASAPSEQDKPPFEAPGPLYFGEFRDRFVLRSGQWKFLERRGSVQMKY